MHAAQRKIRSRPPQSVPRRPLPAARYGPCDSYPAPRMPRFCRPACSNAAPPLILIAHTPAALGGPRLRSAHACALHSLTGLSVASRRSFQDKYYLYSMCTVRQQRAAATSGRAHPRLGRILLLSTAHGRIAPATGSAPYPPHKRGGPPLAPILRYRRPLTTKVHSGAEHVDPVNGGVHSLRGLRGLRTRPPYAE